MLTRLGCDVIDMGRGARRSGAARSRLPQGGLDRRCSGHLGRRVGVGEAILTKQMMAKLGEVVFWKIAMRPGRPMAFGRIETQTENAGKSAYLFGLPATLLPSWSRFTTSCAAHCCT